MNCPHCGAERLGIDEALIEFECGTEIIRSQDFEELYHSRNADCYSRQISKLKAELSRCVRRDDPRLREVANELERGSNMALDNMEGAQGEDFIAWEQVHCDFANQRNQLQSIIEGK